MKTHVIEVTSFLFDGLEKMGGEPVWLQFPRALIPNAIIEDGDMIVFRTVTAEGEEDQALTRSYRFRGCHHLQAQHGWESVLHLTPIMDFKLERSPF